MQFYYKKITTLFILFAMSGCISEKEKLEAATRSEINAKILKITTVAEDALKSRLLDPDSVIIKDRFFSSNADEYVSAKDKSSHENTAPQRSVSFGYCFSYNAKNKMGGYTGYKTVQLQLYYLKDNLFTKRSQEALDYYIDAMHFAVLRISDITGKDIKTECTLDSASDNTKGIADSVYNLLYAEPKSPVVAIADDKVNESVAKVDLIASEQVVEIPATTRTGKQVYQAACFACHGTGALDAPKIGDAADWKPRLVKGMETLHRNAIDGFRAMPPRGACGDCSDDDILNAIDFMTSGI